MIFFSLEKNKQHKGKQTNKVNNTKSKEETKNKKKPLRGFSLRRYVVTRYAVTRFTNSPAKAIIEEITLCVTKMITCSPIIG